MANTVFWILFCLLLAAVVISTALREREKKNRRNLKIREEFGLRDMPENDNSVFDRPKKLVDHLRKKYPDDQYIDDITAADLGLPDVYRHMNRCLTSAGEACMYALIRLIPQDSSVAKARYARISDLAGDRETAVRLSITLSGLSKHDDIDEFEIIKNLSDAKSGSIIRDIAVFILLAVAVAVTALSPVIGICATFVMLVVTVMSYFSGKRLMDENLRALSLALKMIGCAKELYENGDDGFGKYKDLYLLLRGNFLIAYKDQSTTDPLSIIFDYVRMITHIDLIAYNVKINRIKGQSEKLCDLYTDIGTLDCMTGIASYLCNRAHCGAVFSDGTGIDATGMYHPLVDEPVCNDISSKRPVLLTGSNASGKSTFLKSVGINEIFARSFGFAFATSFETGLFYIYSSMATNDDIISGESYYVVEAKSVKRICDAADKGKCLCIIDEIFRGTNTVERIAASSEVLRFLSRAGVLCFAATHDKELTQLLSGEMDLYYFTEEISGNIVTFPFVLKKGVSDKTNAIKLLSMLGFDESIVSSAESLVCEYSKSGKWGSGK